MRIAIDGMGGDHAPGEIVSGVIEAAKQNPDARLLLVGQKDRLSRPDLPPNVEIVHASQVVEMKEEPVKALRSKRDSSLRVAMTLVKQGNADAVISAGNTGAMVAGALFPLFGLGNLEGVKRPGITIPMPVDGGACAMIDVGANTNAKPLHLVQYAVMGSVYIKYLNPTLKLPRVGILNIGEESKKGTDLQKQTYAYLDKASLNFEFVGNIEPHRMYAGEADVVVCDGFSGNLALKTAEGVKDFIVKRITSNGASEEVKAATAHATDGLDHSEYGGAPILGVRGVVIKCHGRSKGLSITNAVKLAAGFIRGGLNDHIVEELRKLSRFGGAWYSKWFSWSKEEEE
jgi:glycerol-3-phosphate acyltransferase PlsX